MENTIENKAKFFAQYWGQLVLLHVETLTVSHIKTAYMNSHNVDIHCLRLKSISSVTDEDAQAITIYWNYKGGLTEYGYKDIEGFKYYTYNSVDYLRSKGYALPYRELTVNKLIEYGWVRMQ